MTTARPTSASRARRSRRSTSTAGNGDDVVRIDESNGVFTDTIATTIDGGNGDDSLVGGSGAGTLQGGNGNDILAGGSGAETLLGGNGNDSIDGNRGNDVALMGNGDDTFVWDPGDGSDIVEGQNGADTMLFNGANVTEQIDLSANGSRLRFFRDVANITMDTDGVETVDFNALGGADLVTVNDLTGTDVSDVNVDLAATSAVRRRRAGRPRRRQRHQRQRHDQRQRRRGRREGERSCRDGRGPPSGGRKRPARDQHPRGQGHRGLRRPGRRCDPALRERRPRPVERSPRQCAGPPSWGPRLLGREGLRLLTDPAAVSRSEKHFASLSPGIDEGAEEEDGIYNRRTPRFFPTRTATAASTRSTSGRTELPRISQSCRSRSATESPRRVSAQRPPLTPGGGSAALRFPPALTGFAVRQTGARRAGVQYQLRAFRAASRRADCGAHVARSRLSVRSSEGRQARARSRSRVFSALDASLRARNRLAWIR